MIKRYGMGVQSIPLGDGVSLNVPDVVEQPDGDYVRYEDYLALSEAIGADGVGSERITQQGKATNMHREEFDRHRAEFEHWISCIFGVKDYAKMDSDLEYHYMTTRLSWYAWKAARGIKE